MDHPNEALPTGRNWSPDLPVSGAWQPGDDPGGRKFFSLPGDRPVVLESGESLGGIVCAYETWGELSAAADNAVLVCHALTGDSHAAGPMTSAHPTDGFWDDIIGPGAAIDTDRYFVVCPNVLGGCQGSTGPASINPATEQPYGSTFPTVTIRDMVRVQASLANHLGISNWLSVVGGSMGGMQVLEWGVMYPQRVRSIAPISTAVAASAWQIGWSAAGRLAIATDPKWRGGDYYDADPGDGPHAGFALARSIAQITYRSDEVFQEKFGRGVFDPTSIYGKWDRFQVESYLDYHGEKLVRRFDANSYMALNKAMDLHDLSRSRGSHVAALRRLQCPVLTMSMSNDALYHPWQQAQIHELVLEAGGDSTYSTVDTPHGHDGFLLETDGVGEELREFLERIEKAG